MNAFVLPILLLCCLSTIWEYSPPFLSNMLIECDTVIIRKETLFSIVVGHPSVSVVISFPFFVWGSIVLLSDVIFTEVSFTEKNYFKQLKELY